MIALALVLLLALALDRLLGEPRRWHPLVGLGRYAAAVESALHGDARRRGLAALLFVLAPPVAVAMAVSAALAGTPWAAVIGALALCLAIGGRSLDEHARLVGEALAAGDLPLARRRVARIVSRDCRALDAAGTVRATVESVLENGSDAIIAPLFWFAVAGLPGVIAYRIVNTLDAIWGYRTPRYRRFGWAAARLDDLMNYLPARLTAAAYAVPGRFPSALACWRRQGWTWESPNAGPVMAAGAGSLGIVLGGPARYHGEVRARPLLGQGRAPAIDDIARALGLLRQATALVVVVLVAARGLADALV